MAAQSNAPVIVKRIKKVSGGGHHGGAWKVAYADFVTAMMAFFMLMWLLGATTEKQRKGIADYFNPTIPVNRISGGGEGAFGGDSVFSEETFAQNGTGAALTHPTEENQSRGDTGVDLDGAERAEAPEPADNEALRELEELLQAGSGESLVSDLLRRHIVTRLSDEGLVIELFDTPDEALFDPGTAEPTQLLGSLVGELARLLRIVPNQLSVAGHTAARPVVLARNDTWPLSIERAGAVHELLDARDQRGPRTVRVTGHADRRPAAANPMAPQNNRIEIVVLRNRV